MGSLPLRALRWLIAPLALAPLALPLPGLAGPCPQWQNAIVFTRDDPASGYDLFVVQPDGSGLTHLDTNRERWDGEPRWSPDHCQIIYSAAVKGADEAIRVINPDGGGMRTLIGHTSPDRYWNPAFSPDGSRIAFAVRPKIAAHKMGEDDIWVANADGSHPVRITDMPGDEHWLDWSPVDDRIAFKAEVTGRNDIFVINADGSGLTQLTDHQKANMHPAWSPDARQIAFTSNRTSYVEIWIMNADGSAPRQITHFGDAIPGAPQYLAFSPDGRQLVFSMYPKRGTNDTDLYVMNLDGSGLYNLTARFSTAADGVPDIWADW